MIEKSKIFVVDDDQLILKFLAQTLSTEYEVISTFKISESIKLIKENMPDIIISDLMMPEMTGFDFCKLVKSDETLKNIPIIFMSSDASSENILMGLEVGGVDFVSKPLKKAEIVTRIKTHLAIMQVQKNLIQSNNNLNAALSETAKILNEEIYNNERISAVLVESENRYKNIFEGIPEAIIIVNVDSGEIVDANNAACELFGYSYEELIGMNQVELLQTSEESIHENFINTQSDNLSYNSLRMSLNTLVKKNGEKIPVKNSSKTILLEGELYIFALIFDLSELVKIGNELKLAKTKAEELNRLKGFFLANMSHELRTPLIGILGYAQILEDELTDDSLKSMAQAISKGGNRLLNTLKVLLEYSILENGIKEIEWNKINLNKIVTKVIDSFKDVIDERGLVVTFNSSQKEIQILADCGFMNEVISQLMNNAITYTHRGSISLKLETQIENNVKFAVFSIKDTGIGISENKIDLIFDDFRQVSEGCSREYEGLGLGLALVKKIVKLHNGEITVQSKENEGSLFQVKLEMK